MSDSTANPENSGFRILFVCLGNICRSPTAEAVFRAIAAREAPELELTIGSAGTADYHVGSSPDARSQEAARRRKYDMSALRARQIEPQDFARFDLILAMDRSNWLELRQLAGASACGCSSSSRPISRRTTCPIRTTAVSTASRRCSI